VPLASLKSYAGTVAAAWQSSIGSVVGGSAFSAIQSAAMGGAPVLVGVVQGAAGAAAIGSVAAVKAICRRL
jgi:hypothetical protein